MIRQFSISVVKNGTTFNEDEEGREFLVPEGRILMDALEDLGFSAKAYQKVEVNGRILPVCELENYKVTSDIEVVFISKSEGGR